MQHDIWAIVMLSIPVTVYEIMTFNLFKWFVFESDLQKNVNITSYDVAECVIESLHDVEKK